MVCLMIFVLYYGYVCLKLLIIVVYCLFFFFKQKTAYEMRISDWSSDVCSSDLRQRTAPRDPSSAIAAIRKDRLRRAIDLLVTNEAALTAAKIGRASCRERVCQYV